MVMVILMAPLAVACSGKRSDILRVPSPDQRFVAVVTRDDTGGTTISSEYDVHLNQTSDTAPQDHPVLVATRCENIALVWEAPKSLKITYDGECVIRRFVNRWYGKSENSKDQPAYIEILLSRR
jgi:hypothetical protein